jgi:amino acid transporter
MRLLTSSPKTTAWGVVTALGGVLVAINTIEGAEQAFDDLFTNGSTWAKVIGTAMVAVGGVFFAGASRDNHVTSEEANAK